MEIGKKTIAAAVGLFFLGGLSVYLVMANSGAPTPTVTTQHKSAAMQEALEQVRANAATTQEQSDYATPVENNSAPATTEELTHEAFLAQAEARREERLINKEENDRLAKLKAMKERSVECKFWKQQQKTSSAAAKIEEKINEHCNLPSSSTASESSAASEDVLSSAINESVNE